MSETFIALAPAKINIGLEILGRRADGYHEIVSVLQTIEIVDTFHWADNGEPFSLESPTDIPPASDLVRRALETASNRKQWTGTLTVTKQIPMSAGLGGGSTDAATALLIADPDASPDLLHARAARLGSDVPFFLTGGTAIARGTGTDLHSLSGPESYVVILTPNIEIASKTATLYGSLSVADFSDGQQVEQIAGSLAEGEIPRVQPPNAFTRALETRQPVRDAREALLRAGAPWVTVSGAGPSLYTMVQDQSQALAIARRVTPEEGQVFVARTVSGNQYTESARELGRRIHGTRPVR